MNTNLEPTKSSNNEDEITFDYTASYFIEEKTRLRDHYGFIHSLLHTYLPEEQYLNKPYIILEYGLPSRNFYPTSKITDDKRSSSLVNAAVTCIFNKSNIALDELKTALYFVNSNYLANPAPIIAVDEIAKWALKKRDEGNLDIQTNNKKIWIDPKQNLSRQEKRRIIGQCTGKLRKLQTVQKLIQCFDVLWSEEPGRKITQKMIAAYSNMSINTIKKYWSELKEHRKAYYVNK